MRTTRTAPFLLLVAWLTAGAGSPAGAETDEEIYGALPPLVLRELAPDMLAFGETLRFIAGSAQGGYTVLDGPGDRFDLGLSASGYYSWQLERERWGYDFTAQGSMNLDSTLTDASKSVEWNLDLRAVLLDMRYYVTPGRSAGRQPWQQGYVHVQAGADPFSFGVAHESAADTTEQWGRARALVGAGFGMGRLIDIGPRLRLLKLERMLRDHGLLKAALPQGVADRILLTWFALRDRIGSHDQLAYTLKALHDVGLLAGDPSLSAVYEFLAIYDDPLLDGRMLGRDLRFTFRAGYDHSRQRYSVHTTNLGTAEFLLSYDETFHLDLDAYVRLWPSVSFRLQEQETGMGNSIWQGWDMALWLPAQFVRNFYDGHYHAVGRMRISPAFAYLPLNDDFQLACDFGYDFAFSRGHYYSVGVSASLFNADQFFLGFTFSYTWGRAAGYFTTYGPLEPELGWLPL